MKAAAYARYSTDKQTENSVAYQFNKIREYCRENGIEISAYYSDEAESGTNMDRIGFIDMVASAVQHEFDAVVIYDITRGSRDVGDWFNFRKQMMRLGIKVISATQKLGDITNPNDFLVELISVGLGEHQVLDTRQKSIAGMAERAKKGVFCGGIPPLGYDIIEGQYVINEVEAETVRIIFAEYATGASYNAIVDKLNGRLGKFGRPLGKNSLCDILQNERYIGVYTWNKRIMRIMRKWAGGKLNPNVIRMEGIIPQIIDLETWERVRDRMKQHERRAANKAKRDYLLSGLIECVDCGSAYVGHTCVNHRKDGSSRETRYYVCGNKYRTHTCKAKNINADLIETFVVQQLKAYLLESDFKEVAERIAGAVNSAAPDCSKEKAELAGVEKKISNGVNAVLAGMAVPELQEEIDRLRTRKSELEDIIAHKKNDGRKVDPARIIARFQRALETWDSDLKRIVQEFVTKIYANPDGSFSVQIGVHIDGAGGGKTLICATFYYNAA